MPASAKTTRVNISPELLRWAVERARHNYEAYKAKDEKLRSWDQGERATLKQLQKFADKVNVPFGMLFAAEPWEEKLPIPDLRTIGSSPITRPSGDLLDTIYMCQDRQNWYRDYVRKVGLSWAPPARLDFIGSATKNTPVKDAAAAIRQQLGLKLTGSGLFPKVGAENTRKYLIAKIEGRGVLVMVNSQAGGKTHRRLRVEEFRGFTLCDPLAPLIFVNASDTRNAQIFTLIHELAHLWLGASGLSDADLSPDGQKKQERWCNRVAAEVLVPAELLSENYRDSSVKELERLAGEYRVSTLVVLKQVFEAGLLGFNDYLKCYRDERERLKSFADRPSSRGRGGGDYYALKRIRVSERFARALIPSALEGSTLYREAHRLLEIKNPQVFDNLASRLGWSDVCS